MSEDYGVAVTMVGILGSLVAMVGGLVAIQEPLQISSSSLAAAAKNNKKSSMNNGKPTSTGDNGTTTTTIGGRYFPCPITEPSKRAYEKFVSVYTPVWMGLFSIIVIFQLYEDFTAMTYLQVCGGLALPFLLQPIFLPSCGFDSPDAIRPLVERYAFKANVWIAVYSFIGNYWYTHCTYSLQ